MNFETDLKYIIKVKYGSVRAFSRAVGIPYSSIDNIFKRGIMGVSVQIVLKICRSLNIDIEKIADDELVFKQEPQKQLTPSEKQLIRAYRAHPEMQPAIHKMLDIPAAPDSSGAGNTNIGSDIADTITKIAAVQTAAKQK